MKPFSQVPVYEPDTQVKIPIEDFAKLQEFLKIFAEPFNIVQQAYFASIRAGDIKFKYIEEDGTEITEEDARARIKLYNESQSES